MTPRLRMMLESRTWKDQEFNFTEIEREHLSAGYCVSSPDYYICAKPVIRDHPEMENLNFSFNPEECDCWFVWMASGDLRLLWTVLPHDLRWTAFYRHGTSRIRYYNTDKLRRRSHGRQSTKSTTKTCTCCSSNRVRHCGSQARGAAGSTQEEAEAADPLRGRSSS